MAIQKTRFKFVIVCVDTGNIVSPSRYNPYKLEQEIKVLNSYCGREKYVLKRVAAWKNNEVICHEMQA